MRLKDVKVGGSYLVKNTTHVPVEPHGPAAEYWERYQKISRLRKEVAEGNTKYDTYFGSRGDSLPDFPVVDTQLVEVVEIPVEIAPGYTKGKFLARYPNGEIQPVNEYCLHTVKTVEKVLFRERKSELSNFLWKLNYHHKSLTDAAVRLRMFEASPAIREFQTLLDRGWKLWSGPPANFTAPDHLQPVLAYLGLNGTLEVDIADPDFSLLKRMISDFEGEVPEKALEFIQKPWLLRARVAARAEVP